MKYFLILAMALGSGSLLADDGYSSSTGTDYYGNEALEDQAMEDRNDVQAMEEARMEDVREERELDELERASEMRSSNIGGASAPRYGSEENELYE